MNKTSSAACAVALLAALPTSTLAAENFAVRYNIVGTLGGDMFAPADLSGWIGVGVLTTADIREITGANGHAITTMVPGGAVPLPPPTPSSLYPTYPTSTPTLHYTAHEELLDVAAAYLTKEKFGGGQLLFGVTLPYGTKNQHVDVTGPTPTLSYNPAIPSDVQAVVNPAFDAEYQSALRSSGAAATNRVSGLAEIELMAGWLRATSEYKLTGSLTLSLPSGAYDTGPHADLTYGRYYTLKPEVSAEYFLSDNFALAGKMDLGLNTTNHDNHWRSGNWVSGEVAAGYKTPVGVVGLHAVHIQQIQDDVNSGYGTNRLRSENVGAFFTTLIPGAHVPVTLQYMKTVDSRYSISANFFQLRAVKVF